MRRIDEDSTLYLYFNTIDSDGAPVAPSSAFTTSDFSIHKNGSAVEKTSTNGLTMTSPFDSETGLHLLTIDTSNDTGDASWWENDAQYQVRFNTTKTVDSTSIDGRLVPSGEFKILTETTAPTAAAIRTEIDSNSTQLAAIVADTDELQGNQGDWATATGFATPTNVTNAQTAIIAEVDANETKIDTLTTNVATVDSNVDAILLDTDELQTNQGNWLTATGFSTHSAADVWSVATRVLTAGTNLSFATQAQVATEISDALTVDTLIDGKTIQQALQYCGAILAGEVTGAGTGTEVFVGLDGSTTRVTVTVDASGNRSDMTYNG